MSHSRSHMPVGWVIAATSLGFVVVRLDVTGAALAWIGVDNGSAKG